MPIAMLFHGKICTNRVAGYGYPQGDNPKKDFSRHWGLGQILG